MRVCLSVSLVRVVYLALFFFNDTATTEIYTLSLHDALPIWMNALCQEYRPRRFLPKRSRSMLDRKSTRLNSSHLVISYAVFCLTKKTPLAELRSGPDRTTISEGTVRAGRCD